MAVSRITIHHEGGSGTGYHDLAYAGYSAEVYDGGTQIFRSPFDSWGTYGHNHESFDICLSGNRMTDPVTDADIANICDLVRQAMAKGWVASWAEVYPHGTLYSVAPHPGGSSPTQCPGTKTVARWDTIYNAVHAVLRGAPVPIPVIVPKVPAQYSPGLGPIVAVWKDAEDKVLAAVADNGDVYAWAVPHRNWPNQAVDFKGRHAARIGQAKGLPKGRYTITATSGETYTP